MEFLNSFLFHQCINLIPLYENATALGAKLITTLWNDSKLDVW